VPIQPHQRRWIEENLIDHDIAFVVFGGVAVKHYCPERQTDDVDIFVGADEQTIGRLVGNIAQLRADPKSRAKLRDPRVAHFKVGDPMKIDVLTYAPGLQIEEALKTAEVVEVEGVAIPILSRELLIEHKRAVGEPKDLEDVALLLAGS
jgi:predicted nucleotidyltransferase